MEASYRVPLYQQPDTGLTNPGGMTFLKWGTLVAGEHDASGNPPVAQFIQDLVGLREWARSG